MGGLPLERICGTLRKLFDDEREKHWMGNNNSFPPNYHFSRVLMTLSKYFKISLELFRASCSKIRRNLEGARALLSRLLVTTNRSLVYHDSNNEIKEYCIRKNGEFPSRIDHYDSLKSISFSTPTENIRRLLFPPRSSASTLHDGAIWGWTPDGVYLRVLIGDVSMLLTFEEVASLREILFPRNKIDGESVNG